VCFAPGLKSQTTYGQVEGNVLDSQGAIISGVKVTVTNEATGERYSQLSNEAGVYSFHTLIPGTYQVHVEMTGFRPVDIRGIALQVNQTARVDLKLEVGALTEAINVEATAPVLSQDTSDVGQVITSSQVTDLPLNGRNFMQLAILTNGVILNSSAENGAPVVISEGGRRTQNSYLVDGIETRIQREGFYGLNLSIDAIEEFKLMQNTFSAEYGRATAIVNTVVRSGTNSVHGSLFEFSRNDALDARNAFDLTGTLPPLRLNQFGGSVGGPIKRDKLFYFANYEGQRIRTGSTRYALVPTDAQFGGDLRGLATVFDPQTGSPFPNNQIPTARISQFAKATQTYYLKPNGSPLRTSTTRQS
jgi:hypothetical protein